MRDFDKVEEGKGSSNLKPVIIFVLLCLVIVGAVAYIIINLTEQYNFLSEQYVKIQDKVMKISSEVTPENLLVKKGEQQGEKVVEKEKLLAGNTIDNVGKTGENEKEVKTSVALAKNTLKVEEITSGEEIIVTPKENAKNVKNVANEVQNIKEYYLLELLAGKNIDEVSAAADFYSKYFNNVRIKPDKNEKSFIVQCCMTNDIDELKLNQVEAKRRFNLNPSMIKVSEWVYKENSKTPNQDSLHYILQLSTNTTNKEATDIMNFYKQYYFDTYVTLDENDKVKWYRVRCCFSQDIDEAKKRLEEIMSRFNISPVIIAAKEEIYKEVKPEYKYVLELNRKKSLKDAKEIVDFYNNYLKDAYISKDKDERNETIYTIKCCVSSTEKEAERMKSDLKDRFNILSSVVKVDLQKEERVALANEEKNVSEPTTPGGSKDKKSNVRYVLQLVSNRNEKETIEMANFYKKYFEDISVVSQKTEDNTIWYKIRCCSTEELDEANKKLKEIKEQFNIEPIIVKTTQ